MRLAISAVLWLAVACSGAEPATYLVSGVVTAGPTCPVVSDPPDPECADRPVASAGLLFVGDGGREFEATTDAAGRFEVALPPGDYLVEPQPVEGLMGTPTSFEIQVMDEPLDIGVIAYDTGIR